MADPTRTLTTLSQYSARQGTSARNRPLGDCVDPRSDIFSLGVVIYEMTTGRRPFRGANVAESIHAVLHDNHEAVSVLNPGVPPELDQLVSTCLAKDKAHRYQTAADVDRPHTYQPRWRVNGNPVASSPATQLTAGADHLRGTGARAGSTLLAPS